MRKVSYFMSNTIPNQQFISTYIGRDASSPLDIEKKTRKICPVAFLSVMFFSGVTCDFVCHCRQGFGISFDIYRNCNSFKN